jgi:hypothetical protein
LIISKVGPWSLDLLNFSTYQLRRPTSATLVLDSLPFPGFFPL